MTCLLVQWRTANGEAIFCGSHDDDQVRLLRGLALIRDDDAQRFDGMLAKHKTILPEGGAYTLFGVNPRSTIHCSLLSAQLNYWASCWNGLAW